MRPFVLALIAVIGGCSDEWLIGVDARVEGCPEGSVPIGSHCVPIRCDDVTKNGVETDVDCGGANECRRCEPGESCLISGDCVTDRCIESKCVEPTCDDADRNALETDVDCGGA